MLCVYLFIRESHIFFNEIVVPFYIPCLSMEHLQINTSLSSLYYDYYLARSTIKKTVKKNKTKKHPFYLMFSFKGQVFA